ncbi:unnamed protein product [Ambrosiozyma monospora]|uniref:Unnamed protein product n=1 Tax=Ambrosiozyma monospora TaxID=43982 RepID=A0ACB5TQB1_AMBMO|nr:unnamed protein product [Ambrosiozyma monospora]
MLSSTSSSLISRQLQLRSTTITTATTTASTIGKRNLSSFIKKGNNNNNISNGYRLTSMGHINGQRVSNGNVGLTNGLFALMGRNFRGNGRGSVSHYSTVAGSSSTSIPPSNEKSTANAAVDGERSTEKPVTEKDTKPIKKAGESGEAAPVEDAETLDEILEQQPDLGEKSDAKHTGVIKTEKRVESLFYFHHMLPYLSGRYDYTHKFFKFFHDDSEEALRKKVMEIASTPISKEEGANKKDKTSDSTDSTVTATPAATPIKPLDLFIDELIIVKRDGGCFVKFDVPTGMPVVEFNKQVMANVQAHAHESFFYRYILRPNCFPVKVPLYVVQTLWTYQ